MKVVKLTEKDLSQLIKKVLKESEEFELDSAENSIDDKNIQQKDTDIEIEPSDRVINSICDSKKFCEAQGPITFGQLRSLVDSAIQKRISLHTAEGGYKATLSVLPWFIPQLAFGGVLGSAIRSINKIVRPALTETTSYRTWWGKVILKIFDIFEGEINPSDPFSRIFFISDGLMNLMNDENKVKFARYISEVASKKPDNEPVPDFFVENELRNWINRRFLLDPPLKPKTLSESVENGKVTCDECGWSWNLSDGGDEPYVCHKCGHDNTPSKSNLEKIVDVYGQEFPEILISKKQEIKNFVKDFVEKSGYNVKFLNNCYTGFAGVRTENEVIICAPKYMQTLGDFIYTIFHEIRHEEQMTKLNFKDPFTNDLENMEKIYEDYWKLEMDADTFGKRKVAELVKQLNIPLDLAKMYFGFSSYIDQYPSLSKSIFNSVKQIVEIIKDMRKKGISYQGIQDIPMIKQHLDRLENFI